MTSELTDAEIDVPTRDHRLDIQPAELEVVTDPIDGVVAFFDGECEEDGEWISAGEDHVLEGAEME